MNQNQLKGKQHYPQSPQGGDNRSAHQQGKGQQSGASTPWDATGLKEGRLTCDKPEAVMQREVTRLKRTDSGRSHLREVYPEQSN